MKCAVEHCHEEARGLVHCVNHERSIIMHEGIKVLDHGYVRFVESWGSDERIVEAARMSTGKGFLGWGPKHAPDCGTAANALEDGAPHCVGCGYSTPGDEKLLRFLYENKHATPFEMAGMTVEVQAPIFVFREWHRHRTQCLAGDTMICCVSPRGTTYWRSIKDIFDLKHGGVEDGAPRTKNGRSKAGTSVTRVLPNCQNRLLRVLNEATGDFTTATMADVWESGVKQVYSVTTESGHRVAASAEHPFFTELGWVKTKDLKPGIKVARMGKVAAFDRPIPPALRAGIGVWTSMMRSRLIDNPDACYLCEKLFTREQLDLDHVIPVAADLKLALDVDNLRPICERCHRNKTNAEQPSREGMTKRGIRWEPVHEIRKLGREMTYDIEVDGPHHNYVANWLVVHNSYNEMSARYTPLPDVNYIPTVERLMMSAGTSNKQAGTVAGAKALDRPTASAFRNRLLQRYAEDQEHYEWALDAGVPKELARVHLPVGRYSRMMASTDLRNWLGFLALRMAPNAQWEIQQYARAVGSLVAGTFPRTWALFAEGSHV